MRMDLRAGQGSGGEFEGRRGRRGMVTVRCRKRIRIAAPLHISLRGYGQDCRRRMIGRSFKEIFGRSFPIHRCILFRRKEALSMV